MSKERRNTRVERATAAQSRAAAAKAARERAAETRARQERRSLLWRRMRLWQHGPGFHRRREAWGAIATAVLLVMLVVYIFTRSITAVLGTVLVGIISAPILAMLATDRSHK